MLSVTGLVREGLEPVTLSVAPGECVALVGPSGSGKSLLLRAIADLDPNEGEVSLGDDRRDSMPAPRWRRRVVYVPAESGWWTDVTGDHFADRAAAAELLARLGLAEAILASPVTRLSTGERQRLALARALLVGPEALLLDEPTSGLDQRAAGYVEMILGECLERGSAILMVTHDPEQAARLARRRLVIEGGRVRDDGGGAEEPRDAS